MLYLPSVLTEEVLLIIGGLISTALVLEGGTGGTPIS